MTGSFIPRLRRSAVISKDKDEYSAPSSCAALHLRFVWAGILRALTQGYVAASAGHVVGAFGILGCTISLNGASPHQCAPGLGRSAGDCCIRGSERGADTWGR